MVEEEADIEETEATLEDDTQTATNVFQKTKNIITLYPKIIKYILIDLKYY